MAKLTFMDFANALRETSKVSYDTRGSYSYATGLYESMLADLLADMPERRQAEAMRSLKRAQESMRELTA